MRLVNQLKRLDNLVSNNKSNVHSDIVSRSIKVNESLISQLSKQKDYKKKQTMIELNLQFQLNNKTNDIFFQELNLELLKKFKCFHIAQMFISNLINALMN